MVIAGLSDQLGNQMFAYASVKSICLDKGYPFGYYRVPLAARFINDSDKKYGSDLSTIFQLPEQERVDHIPEGYSVLHEVPIAEQNAPDYRQRFTDSLMDPCITQGHFMSTVLFADKLDQLREWFAFPEDIYQKTADQLAEIKKRYHDRPVVTVHFRVGKDYYYLGLRMERSYWTRAADLAKKTLNDPLFLCLYDKKTLMVKDFMKKYQAIETHGSLVEDMCMIACSDANIVCNSSFSTMGALINRNSQLTIAPDRFLSGIGYNCLADSAFLPSWTKIEDVHHDKSSYFLGLCRNKARRILLNR